MNAPDLKCIQWIKQKHDSTIEQSIAFKAILSSDTDTQNIKSAFHEMKSTFKELEFIYYYLDPQTFSQSINGAPLPKLQKKVPDMTILEPKGLQRMEEMIYGNEELSDLAKQVEMFIKNLRTYNGLINQQYINDPIIFEALRYGVIRINTMGITGFDSPGNPDLSLKDAALFFKSYSAIISQYSEFIPKEMLEQSLKQSEKAYLKLNDGAFDSFDRFDFITNNLDPIWRSSLSLQQRLRIELPNQRFSKLQRPVNYEASSLYAQDFLNVSYFSEYTNEKIEDQIKLGRSLFFDKRLSRNNKSNCASCHHPGKAFTDGLPRSKNLVDGGAGKRNSPTLLNAVFAERYFHDMRVDRLAFQMDHVVLNPIEFNTRYDTIISRLRKDNEFNSDMIAVYGKEGITKNTITNSMSAFIASLTSFNSPFDKMIRKEIESDDQSIIEGFNLFMGKASCGTCHFPPTFSGLLPPEYAESESEVLGVPNRSEEPEHIDPDLGRYMNHILKEQAPFYKHAFKTPTVRNVKSSAPYMHNGIYNDLDEVIDFYDVGGGIGLNLDVPNQTLPAISLNLTESEKMNLIIFLESLEDNPYQDIAP